MIANVGEMSLTSLDSANVPVDIWLTKREDWHEWEDDTHKWQLSCGVYMPRKGQVWDSAVMYRSAHREELAALLNRHIIPLYQTALAKLTGIVDGHEEDLYYWDPPEQKDES